MSHFYAFDRKQSLLLLCTGILLAVLVCLLGWIIGLLMRPAPETAAPAAAQTEQGRRSADSSTASAPLADASSPDARATSPAVDPSAPEAAVRQTTGEARSAVQTAGQKGTRKAAAVMESARGRVPQTASPAPSSPAESAANSTQSAETSAPSAAGPAGSSEAAGPDPESGPQVPTDATGAPPEESSGSGSKEPTPDFGPNNRFVVVADTFVVGSKAKARVAELKANGYAPRLLETPAADTAGRLGLYSVILGDYSRMETAEAAAQRFREAGEGTPMVRSVPATELPPDGAETAGSAASDGGESTESESASPSAG